MLIKNLNNYIYTFIIIYNTYRVGYYKCLYVIKSPLDELNKAVYIWFCTTL